MDQKRERGRPDDKRQYLRDWFQRKKKEDPEWYERRKKYYSAFRYPPNKFTVKAYRRGRRLVALEHYGGSCACCGEDEYSFLAIDHVNSDGAKHRREIKMPIVDWLFKNEFPEGFQVLCHNCNMAKHYLGECPHKTLVLDR